MWSNPLLKCDQIRRCWVEMSAAMPGRPWKLATTTTTTTTITTTKNWLKRLKVVHQKTKFGPKYKWFKISWFKSSSTRSTVLVDIFRVSSIQKVSKPAKITEKDHSFYNTVSLKKPHSIYESQLTLKIIWPCNIAKTFLSLPKFSSKHASVCCQKKHLHSTISWRPKLHFWSTLKANVRLFLYISVRKDIVRFSLKGGGLGEAE